MTRKLCNTSVCCHSDAVWHWTHGGIVLKVDYVYESGQAATDTDPAYDPEITLASASIGDYDITPLLAKVWIDRIEAYLLKYHME
jgi:hypothetical protein